MDENKGAAAPMPGSTCGSCRFARKQNPADFSKAAPYLCTRFPPQVSVVLTPTANPGVVNLTRDSAYPTVQASSFACGEFAAREALKQ